MNAFDQWWSEYEARQIATMRQAATAVLDAPVELLAEYQDETNGRLGHFLQTTGKGLIGREVLSDDEHGGEASTPEHRAGCRRRAREYELWQR